MFHHRFQVLMILLALISCDVSSQTHALPSGWSLVGNNASGSIDPVAIFGNATAPNSVTSSISSVWTWNNVLGNWSFFSPTMTTQANSAYATVRGYGPLTSIAQGEGFWVNATSAVSITLSASPLPSGTFAFQGPYSTLIANGLSRTFTISGTCPGSGSRTSAPARAGTTFEGVPALSAVVTLTMTLNNCTPASIAQTYTSYFDNNYAPLGMNSVGVNYGVFTTALVIPQTVVVGNTAILSTEALYTDSSKATSNGRIDQSYVVSSETSTSAIVTVIGKIYNASGILTATEQDRFRITSSGVLTPISVDIQYSYSSTAHLVLTYN